MTEAEAGLLDLVTIEDGLRLQSDDPFRPDERTDRVRGRLDALLVAARVAPLTRHVGLVPTVVVTHTEPFHASKAVATLDHVSSGRAGVRVQVAARPDTAAHFGRREPAGGPRPARPDGPVVAAADRRACSTRPPTTSRCCAGSGTTGRTTPRSATSPPAASSTATSLHAIDFVGEHFSVRGPSITPRPPQGQPVVAALAHAEVPYRLVGRAADLGFVTPRDEADAADLVAQVAAQQRAAGRADERVHVFGDLVVLLDEREATARARRERLDLVAGEQFTSDATVFAGTPAQPGRPADRLARRRADRVPAAPGDGAARPAAGHPRAGARAAAPGLFRTAYPAAGTTLRGLLGLPRPASRYALA
ncbi:FMNH2-utilizing oxygenase [Angustibacter aerolatus]|uniref:FMNH2-utilizing oxygenase n=1 Tax=Angustibacter aerolatus TaxID=1162965 RepID=A0ABQ6JDT7_9ACTN|nr:FMNH2-utilizing oxygenase [Angustibacter aerolatus]